MQANEVALESISEPSGRLNLHVHSKNASPRVPFLRCVEGRLKMCPCYQLLFQICHFCFLELPSAPFYKNDHAINSPRPLGSCREQCLYVLSDAPSPHSCLHAVCHDEANGLG